MLEEIVEGGDRALVISDTDEERVARLAEPLRDATVRADDSLLLEPRSGYVYERIPKAEALYTRTWAARSPAGTSILMSDSRVGQAIGRRRYGFS